MGLRFFCYCFTPPNREIYKLLEAKGIHVTMNGNEILKNISISIEPGEFVVMIGANGAGKSTALKVLSGELLPSCGTVTLNNIVLSKWNAQRRAQRLAVLPQSSSLNFGLRTREVVGLGRLPHEQSHTQTQHDEIIREAMKRTGLLALSERSYLTLSGGEQLRVHLARTIAQVLDYNSGPAKFLLLDEPTSSLDLNHQLRVLEVVRDLVTEGLGIFAILHDINLAARFADRIYVLKSGICIRHGTVENVVNEELLLDAFGLKSKVINVDGLDHPTVCVLKRAKDAF
ncbi:MAG: heme ABC transporter ATP-binding protein [Myxococcota bacterium]|nr:heme ABC transporter ATP-binding protein [Myxococcota bacterium]